MRREDPLGVGSKDKKQSKGFSKFWSFKEALPTIDCRCSATKWESNSESSCS